MSTNAENQPFRVVFESYAERHFIKDFQKKYKSNWITTRKALVAQYNNVDLLLKSGRLTSPIHESQDKAYAIHKHDFAVAGMKQSARSSGNRAIIHIDYKLRTVHVLLVYSKNQISSPNETAKWQTVVKKEFPEFYSRFDQKSE